MNSSGIAGAGGLGKALAEWIAEGVPTYDLGAQDVRRTDLHHNNVQFLRERIPEVLGNHYNILWPKSEMKTARLVKRSPLYSRLDEAGASWGCVMGWERANWFARNKNGTDTDSTST